MSSIQHTSTTHLLLDLEKRRSLIEKLLSIARSIESLKGSLEALVLHNQASDQIPDVFFAFIGSLGKKIKNLSDAEIALRLATLEKKTNFKFDNIRTLIEQINSGTDALPLFEHSETLLDDFRRQTQTSLALRCLLKKRGVKVKEYSLPISGIELKEKLKKISQKELEVRENAVKEIKTLMHDIDCALSGDHGRAMQTMLTDIKQALLANLTHIQAGKSLFELPTPMENIVLTEDCLESYEYTLLPEQADDAVDTDKNVQSPTEKDEAIAQKVQSVEKTAERVEVKQQITASEEPKGIWQRFVVWLNTPWKVKWKHTKK